MKTNELTGLALDWAVAKCEGHGIGVLDDPWFAPSTNWKQGGPIIEREGLTLDLTNVLFDHETDECVQLDKPEWWASKDDVTGRGPTPLIAAMRCYVASKLGDDIDIPEELIGDADVPVSHKHLKEN